MPSNPFYQSKVWFSLRARALKRDRGICVVPGCGLKATKVDHIETRPRSERPTPADRLDNLRSLCAGHDNQVKEDPSGARRMGGKFIVRGVDRGGMPLDPSHPWNTKAGSKA